MTTENNSLFTEISEVESATVSGGDNFVTLDIALPQGQSFHVSTALSTLAQIEAGKKGISAEDAIQKVIDLLNQNK